MKEIGSRDESVSPFISNKTPTIENPALYDIQRWIFKCDV